MNRKAPRKRRSGPESYVWRRVLVLGMLILVGGMIATGWSIGRAALSPVNDPVSAKLAEWGRDHGLGSVVTGLEALQYRLHPPKIGGTPGAIVLGSHATPKLTITTPGIWLQRPIPPIVVPALKNEGSFKSVVEVHGVSVLQVAYVRPDARHTSYLSAVIWISGKHSRLSQHPGQSDPGHLSLWSKPSSISRASAGGPFAAFNGGFKIKDSRGGYYDNGHTMGVLKQGAASVVVYRDGRTEVGAWGRDVRMDSSVVSVRQNLRLLVDNGKLTSNLDAAVKANWGITVGSTTDVWRSGLGITAKGDLIYVVGDALSARSLATILQHSGAIRAMQLDINRTWVSFMWFTHPASATTLTPHKALDFQRPANRYFFPTSRDFFAVYYR